MKIKKDFKLYQIILRNYIIVQNAN